MAVLAAIGSLAVIRFVLAAPTHKGVTHDQKHQESAITSSDPVKMVRGQVWPVLNPDSAKAVLGKPVSHMDEDPLIVAPTSEHQGVLAYTFPVYKAPRLSNFIVIYNTKSATKTIYPVEVKANRVLQPQFSPDGSALAVMVGTYDSTWPRFRIYILDLRTQQWKKVPSAEINFSHLVWSPDSRSIAFVEGGNIYGEEDPQGEPIRLMESQWQEGKTQVVTQNKGVVGGFCFSPSESLLYSATPPQKDKKIMPLVHPNIYEVTKEGTRHLLIREGHRPTISPDGKRIAFYGAENLEHPSALAREWWNDPQGSSLCTANSDGSARHALNVQRGIYSPLSWPKAQDRLLSLDREQSSPSARFVLKEWNLQDEHWNSLGELHLEDTEEVPDYNEIDPQLRVCGPVDGDNSFFFAQVQVAGQIAPNERRVLRSIHYFDASTGKATLVAQVRDKVGTISGVGIDWCQFSGITQ